jgi:hypothetical protein
LVAGWGRGRGRERAWELRGWEREREIRTVARRRRRVEGGGERGGLLAKSREKVGSGGDGRW